MMVQNILGRLKELKDHPTSSTWFKGHFLVFSNQNQLGQLDITISETDKETFTKRLHNPYIQSVIDIGFIL